MPVDPQLANEMDQLSGNGASIATGLTTGLVSTVSNLSEILGTVDLLADVSERAAAFFFTHLDDEPQQRIRRCILW